MGATPEKETYLHFWSCNSSLYECEFLAELISQELRSWDTYPNPPVNNHLDAQPLHIYCHNSPSLCF